MIGKIINKIRLKRAIKNGLIIGSGTRIISPVNFGSEPYLISIGNHVTVSSNVSFITHDGGTWVIRQWESYKDIKKFGKIVIGDNVFIGLGSIILPGVTIGKNVIVGAGSVVNKNIPDNSVYGGVPARKICDIKEYAEKLRLNSLNYDERRYKVNKKEEILRKLEGK